MFEKIVEVGILFDFYGKLLSNKQYNIVELYYLHDLSLSEIGEQLQISRQGVYDILKRAEKSLYTYEEKLRLVKKFNDNNKKIEEILKYTNDIIRECEKNDLKNISDNIVEIKKMALQILKNNQEVIE